MHNEWVNQQNYDMDWNIQIIVDHILNQHPKIVNFYTINYVFDVRSHCKMVIYIYTNIFPTLAVSSCNGLITISSMGSGGCNCFDALSGGSAPRLGKYGPTLPKNIYIWTILKF